jgi:hypothetical protein
MLLFICSKAITKGPCIAFSTWYLLKMPCYVCQVKPSCKPLKEDGKCQHEDYTMTHTNCFLVINKLRILQVSNSLLSFPRKAYCFYSDGSVSVCVRMKGLLCI